MKVTEQTQTVLSGGTSTQQVFNIKATAKAFDILSSGLYSDKILAIVRELSCNAYDSHVLAGKADVPIEIKFPTSFDSTFHVKDYGTGLSDEDIQGKLVEIVDAEGNVIGEQWVGGLYRTYFDSTKQDSNAFIGALGLGSKSPFSYTSTFNVESRFNGVRRIYTCYKNEQNLPSITLMSESETTEPNGMTISMAVDSNDHQEFETAARKALMYFNPVPVFIGRNNFKPYSLTYTVKGSNWKIRIDDSNSRISGPFVIQGFVAYPILKSILQNQRDLTEAAKVLLSVNIDFHVPIGDVDVAASREALSYDATTIKNLIDVFNLAALEMRDSFQKQFDECSTIWEAGVLFSDLENNPSWEFVQLFKKLHRTTPFTWNGQEVTSIVALDTTSIQSTFVIGYHVQPYSNRRLQRFSAWSPLVTDPHSKDSILVISATKHTHIIIDTDTKGNNFVYERYANKLPGSTKIYIIRPTAKKLYNQAEIDHIVNQLPGAKIHTVNEIRALYNLPLIDPKLAANKQRTKSSRLKWKGFTTKSDSRGRPIIHRTFSHKCWIRHDVDLDAGGFYVPIDRCAVQYENRAHTFFDEVIQYSKNLKLVDDNVVVYGFTEKEVKSLPDDHEWINFFDYIEEQYYIQDANGELLNSYTVATLQKRDWCRDFMKVLVPNWPTLAPHAVDSNFKRYMDKVHNIVNRSAVVNPDDVYKFRQHLNMSELTDKTLELLQNEWQVKVLSKYVVLSVIDLKYKTVDETKTVITDYINMVEKIALLEQEVVDI